MLTFYGSSWPSNVKPLGPDVKDIGEHGSPITSQDIGPTTLPKSQQFLQNLSSVVQYILTSGATVIFLIFFIALPVAMITIGFLHNNQCPLEPKIPVFLIVGGVFLLLRIVIHMIFVILDVRLQYWRAHYLGRAVESFGSVMTVFYVIWFVAGCVFVYRSDRPEFTEKASPNYCEKSLYNLAFWFLNASFIVFGVGAMAIVCFAALVRQKK